MAKLDYLAIKNRRVDLDITQQQLAEITDVGLSTIKAVETGRSLTEPENIQKICDALKLDCGEVYFPHFKDTKVISVINNKGGCGKTSVCSSVGYALAEMGYKVLLIDSDSQRNLTASYNLGKTAMNFGAAVSKEESLQKYIVSTAFENIDIVPADVSMGTLDMLLFTKMHRENIVRQILDRVIKIGIYDFIWIDTNPNLSLLNFNIINASHYCLIPVQPAGFDVEGIVTVVDFIHGVQKFNDELDIIGIVINRYDARNKTISEAAVSELKSAYGKLLFDTIIQVDVKIQNAQWENRPVFSLPSSRIAREYRALTKEIIARCGVSMAGASTRRISG